MQSCSAVPVPRPFACPGTGVEGDQLARREHRLDITSGSGTSRCTRSPFSAGQVGSLRSAGVQAAHTAGRGADRGFEVGGETIPRSPLVRARDDRRRRLWQPELGEREVPVDHHAERSPDLGSPVSDHPGKLLADK
jgi:hypothetical protein